MKLYLVTYDLRSDFALPTCACADDGSIFGAATATSLTHLTVRWRIAERGVAAFVSGSGSRMARDSADGPSECCDLEDGFERLLTNTEGGVEV
ncbi:unnamed protein product, partial [Iphiclides podalirius]